MKQQTTIFKMKFLRVLSCFLIMLFCSSTFYGQTKVLANEVTYSSPNTAASLAENLPLVPKTKETVENKGNALLDDATYARLLASPGLLAGLGSYKGVIELKFPSALPANTWSYVRMEGDSDLFRALLGGSLGNVLGTVLGAVLVGNQEIVVDARMGTTSILSRSSTLGFGTDRVKLMQDAAGNNYLAIRPAAQYDRLRITNETGSLLGLGAEKQLDVYNAFYYDTIGNDCGYPFATSFDGSDGLGLQVGDLNDQNLNRAIDGDTDSFSLLKSSGVLDLSIARSFSQYFYFPTESSEQNTVNIKLALGSGGLVNTDLLGGIEVVFWKGTTEVYKRSLQSGLLNNTDILNILKSGDPAILTFAPSRAFDKVEVRLNSTVGLGVLGSGVRIYDVQRYDDAAGCSNPEIAALPTATPTPFQTPSCASILVDFDNVDFAHRAVDGNNESYATLYADSGSLLVSGPTAGFVEMNLGQMMPANKTTYVRINYDEDVLDRLVGGSLGKLVSDLANNLLLGNQYFEVEAKTATNTVLNASSSNAFEGNANGVVTLVQDNIGRYYIAITPNAPYNKIRITNHVTAVLPTGKKATLDVYNACFEIGTDSCFPANFTSYRGGELNLDVDNISDVGVTNPFRAISDNSSEYSQINLGIAGLLSHVYQTIYFSQPSETDDYVKIRMAIEPSSTLSLDLLGAYKIKFFNGKTQVDTDYTLQQGLINNIDLLALFKSGGIVNLQFTPTDVFDRVEIGAESLVSLNVAAEPLRVYSVKRFGNDCPETIGVSPFESPNCAAVLFSSENTDDVQNVFDGDFDSFATINSGVQGLLGLGGNLEGHIELGYATEVPAGTTSYIRFDYDQDILNGLLGGSLGNVVSGLLNGLLLGDHFFEVDVKHNGTSIVKANSKDASVGGNAAIRVVQDNQGRYYIAVTPDAPYTSVRITDKTRVLLPVGSSANTLNVYGMCYENSADKCLTAFATSYEYTGLNLSVNDLGAAGVTNGSYAINENTTNYSEISNGTLAVGTSTKQWIFFNTTSTATDVVNVKFKTGAGAIDIDVLGGLEIKAYKGNTEVATLDWQNGIVNGINVLDLISNGALVEVPFAPGFEFDRISVGIHTLVGVSVFPPLQLYSVERCFDLSSIVEAVDDTATTNQNTSVTIDVTANDIGMDKTTVTIATQPANGTVVVNPNTGKITYWPNEDFVGTDTFIYQICTDNTETTCDTATVTITVDGLACSVPINGEMFEWRYGSVGHPAAPTNPVVETVTQPATDAGFIFDLYEIDNSFNIEINGDLLATQEIEFNANGLNIRFQDGEVYTPGSNSIWDWVGTESAPIMRVIIRADNSVELYGSKQEGGPLYPLELYGNSSLNPIVWNLTGSNEVTITQTVLGPTKMKGSGYGLITTNTPEISIDTTSTSCAGILELTITGLDDGVYTLDYDNGSFEAVEVINGKAVIVVEVGVYNNITIGSGNCISASGVSIEVTEDTPKATITPDGSVEICEGEFVTLEANAGGLYEWYYNGTIIEFPVLSDPNDPNSTVTMETRTDKQSIEVNEAGDYTVIVINNNGCTSIESDVTTISVNPTPVLTVTGSQMIYVATGANVTWPTATTDFGSIAWYDSNEEEVTNNLPNPFTTVGVYTYTIVAIYNDCYSFETVIVNVYDADACPPAMERVYANNQSWGSIITGGVSNKENAVDGNPKTYSTITTGVGLLGIGTTWQNLYFNNRGEAPIPAGTPVTIKLGKEYSGLALAGGISVVGVKRDGLGTPLDIGVLKPVAGGLLDLLAADNVVEFTFVPSNLSGAKDYDGVRISIGALLSVAQNGKIYGAYYTKPGAPSCDPIDNDTNPNVIDVLHGVKDLGLGVASSTASVVDPWNAVDNDLNTSAKLVRGVSVLNAATLTVIFKQPVQPTDEIAILIKDITNNGVNLNLLTGYQFQRYMGDTPVGNPIQGGDILNLKLLYFSQEKRMLMVDSFAEPYDRIMIGVGSIVQVALSDQMEIFDVSVTPVIDYGQIDGEVFEICEGDDLELQLQDECTTYEVYTSETGTDTLTTTDGFTFQLPTDVNVGENKFYVQAIRDGCPIGPRQEIKVMVNDIPVLDGLEIDGTASIFETTINVSPSDVVEVKPIVNWGTSTPQLHVWEMENPETPGEWIAIPFAETAVDGTIKLTIPAFGEVVLPSGNTIDIRNTEINIRLFLESDKGCITIKEGLILKIDGKSQLISNPNITNKLKN